MPHDLGGGLKELALTSLAPGQRAFIFHSKSGQPRPSPKTVILQHESLALYGCRCCSLVRCQPAGHIQVLLPRRRIKSCLFFTPPQVRRRIIPRPHVRPGNGNSERMLRISTVKFALPVSWDLALPKTPGDFANLSSTDESGDCSRHCVHFLSICFIHLEHLPRKLRLPMAARRRRGITGRSRALPRQQVSRRSSRSGLGVPADISFANRYDRNLVPKLYEFRDCGLP